MRVSSLQIFLKIGEAVRVWVVIKTAPLSVWEMVRQPGQKCWVSIVGKHFDIIQEDPRPGIRSNARRNRTTAEGNPTCGAQAGQDEDKLPPGIRVRYGHFAQAARTNGGAGGQTCQVGSVHTVHDQIVAVIHVGGFRITVPESQHHV